MFTREQRLKGECTHDEYYAQFVNDSILNAVRNGIGVKALLESDSNSFLDIPIAYWDAIAFSFRGYLRHKFKEFGDSFSLAGAVCVMKTGGRIIVSQEREKQNRNHESIK